MNKTLVKKSLLIWLPFAALITFACMLSYLLVQQDLRQTANDPQIQIAESVAQALETGITPQQILSAGQTVDLQSSLDPFVIIFGPTGGILATSAMLNGHAPTIPAGVIDNVRQNGEDRFTWEPQFGVRDAVVVSKVNASASSTGGFVLAGRSLREVEIREDNVLHLAELAWFAGLVGMFLVVWAAVLVYKRKELTL